MGCAKIIDSRIIEIPFSSAEDGSFGSFESFLVVLEDLISSAVILNDNDLKILIGQYSSHSISRQV